ncbi:type 4a pilus biogenesis protein PilO, partial [Candidatus Omnitrophota bacterium]
QSLEKKQMFMLIALIGLIVVSLWVYFLLLPQFSKLFRVFGKTGKLRAEVLAHEADLNRIGIFKKKLEEYKAKIRDCEEGFSDEGELPQVIESVSDMARDSAVKIVSITAIKPSAVRARQLGGFYREIPIMVSARSGYHELGMFISRLESSRKLIKVADVDIGANSVYPKKHDSELLILVYTKPEGKKIEK